MNRRWLALGSLWLVGGVHGVASTSCTEVDQTIVITSSTPKLPAGALCFDPDPTQIRMRFEPRFLAVAPGSERTARLVVDPDFCTGADITFDSSDESVVAKPAEDRVSYGHPTIELDLEALAEGSTTITASLASEDGSVATATIEVEVLGDDALACDADDDVASVLLAAGSSVTGSASLSGASITLPEGSDAPNSGSFLWSVAPFEASLSCADDADLPGYVALGPAVTFGPADKTFMRELPLTIPINPARMPAAARMRHLKVVYSGPAFKAPRPITVADARIEKSDGVWQLSFKVPRLGTYQAMVPKDAGTTKRTRRLTHRAVVGVSMGGAGAAQFGLRNHQLFDVVAAMGGPVDWTYMIDHMEKNHLGGWPSIEPGTVLEDIKLQKTPCTSDDQCGAEETCLGLVAGAGQCTLLPQADEPYEHASTFNNWWYEFPNVGNGGSFSRTQYSQIFRDLALMFGNPNGYNPLQLNLPAGVDPEHKSQTGDHPDGECKIWVDPYDSPTEDKQKELNSQCPVERCQYTQTFDNYYDDEYNPDGTFPVITFCDGTPQDEAYSPYANTWTPVNEKFPLEVGLAVDYNGNGKRDELEPVIRAGHEHWDDWGDDATPSEQEVGYGPENLDPAGDDYDPQYNPSGTEGDHRRQAGEPFVDSGLDGVMGTSSSPYDHGENDGVFTVAPGLQRIWDQDAHSVVRRFYDDAPSGPLDDEALSRLDVWTDGGTRDLFNFLVAARHFAGTFDARGRNVAYFSEFTQLPGLDPTFPDNYNPGQIVWEDLQGVVFQRYGKDVPNEYEYEQGSGQHVGTVNEIAKRLQSSIYFIGSRWPDAPKHLVEVSQDNPAEGVDPCEITGNCTFDFTSSFGRTGPVGVTLPPGYAHAEQQEERYPVVYVLHGYGQTPEDLQAAIVFLANWMNGSTDSQYSRLSKAILVYVDGRCRLQSGGVAPNQAECIRGTFYTNSIRADGPQMESWWLELMDYVDQNYRTMGEATVEWTD